MNELTSKIHRCMNGKVTYEFLRYAVSLSRDINCNNIAVLAHLASACWPPRPPSKPAAKWESAAALSGLDARGGADRGGGLCVVQNGSTGKAQSDVVHLHFMSISIAMAGSFQPSSGTSNKMLFNQ